MSDVTIAIPDDVLAALRARASRSGLDESEVVEEALRRYLDDEPDDLAEIVARIRARSDLDEESSLRLAYEELHATRAEDDARQAS
jgi:predicted transcriptional regulator